MKIYNQFWQNIFGKIQINNKNENKINVLSYILNDPLYDFFISLVYSSH